MPLHLGKATAQDPRPLGLEQRPAQGEPGTPNKVTVEVKEFTQKHGPDACSSLHGQWTFSFFKPRRPTLRCHSTASEVRVRSGSRSSKTRNAICASRRASWAPRHICRSKPNDK